MATIFYSMCGEGRGHATRVQTIADMLIPQHRFVLLAARDAYQQLYERYENHPYVSVRRLPGLFFAYRKNKVDYVRSLMASAPYLWRLSSMVGYLAKMIQRERPHLAITDFEPLLPRAAKRCGIPCISLDHQHFLSASDFRALPWRFRYRALFLRLSIPLFYSGQSGEAVSSFAHLPPRDGTEHIPRIGVLLRKSVVDAQNLSQNIRGHILVYMRRHAPDSLWQALEHSNRDCIVYGLGERPNNKRIQFKPIGEESFVNDLATAECLVSTAGNQLIGEAYFLKKPVLAIPEEGNFEQDLNGWLIATSDCGWSTTFDQLTPHMLQQFLVAVPLLRQRLMSRDVCGNQQAFDFLQQFLPHSEHEEQPFSSRNVWQPESHSLEYSIHE